MELGSATKVASPSRAAVWSVVVASSIGLGCARAPEPPPREQEEPPPDWIAVMRHRAGFDPDPARERFLDPLPRCCGSYALALKIRIDAEGLWETDVFSSERPPASKLIPKVAGVYDYPALEAMAAQFKMWEPHAAAVEIAVEPGVPLGVVANTIIALAGEDCRLSIGPEETPPECLFWAPVVELPDEGTRLRLMVALVERGVSPGVAAWSSMDHRAWAEGRSGAR